MRSILMLIIALLMAIPCAAQQWYTANQVTVQWDAVTTMNNGTPIPPGDIITYNVYTVPRNEPKENAAFSQNTSQTIATITIPDEGWYFMGFQTVRILAGETEPERSAIVWTDNPVYCLDGETFGFKFVQSPDEPTGIERVANREG